jgi:hypothetical protein
MLAPGVIGQSTQAIGIRSIFAQYYVHLHG